MIKPRVVKKGDNILKSWIGVSVQVSTSFERSIKIKKKGGGDEEKYQGERGCGGIGGGVRNRGLPTSEFSQRTKLMRVINKESGSWNRPGQKSRDDGTPISLAWPLGLYSLFLTFLTVFNVKRECMCV